MNKMFLVDDLVRNWNDLDKLTLENPDALLQVDRFSYEFLRELHFACHNHLNKKKEDLSIQERRSCVLFLGNFKRYTKKIFGDSSIPTCSESATSRRIIIDSVFKKIHFITSYKILLLEEGQT